MVDARRSIGIDREHEVSEDQREEGKEYFLNSRFVVRYVDYKTIVFFKHNYKLEHKSKRPRSI